MIWEPLTAWFVALLADGIILVDEKLKGRNQQVINEDTPTQKNPEPHRNPKTGKIAIENTLLYKSDLREYGGHQTLRWAE